MPFRLPVSVLFGVACLTTTVCLGEPKVGRPKPAPQDSVEKRALRLMEDIVPRPPFPAAAARISGQGERGFWGPLFGDDHLAALVAVSLGTKASAPDASSAFVRLCLLRWDGGWKFEQQVGQVPATDDERAANWTIKRRKPSEGYYVLGHLDPDPETDHDSWFCDPATHHVVPTGWRKDAVPSLASDTITFRSLDAPGKHGERQTVYTVHHFDREPGKLIASWQQESREGDSNIYRMSRPDPATGRIVTWRCWEKKPLSRPTIQWAVSRSAGEEKPKERTEDAAVHLQWESYAAEWEGLAFLLERLTGLSGRATEGIWESDWYYPMTGPEKSTVSGLREAIELFTWPPVGKP